MQARCRIGRSPALVLLMTLSVAVPLEGQDEWRPFETSAQRVVPALESLAKWCGSKRLFGERSEVHDLILEFDPDHLPSRRLLGYRRQRDGGWKRRASWRRPRMAKAEVVELATRREAAVGEFVDATLEGIAARREKLGSTRCRVLLERLLRMAPGDPGIHDALGEVAWKGRWVLKESVAASKRARELAQAAARFMRSASTPVPSTATRLDSQIGLDWTGAREAGSVRVVGTVPTEEVESAVRLSLASRALFEKAFGVKVSFPKDYVVYLLGGAGDGNTFIDRYPGMSPEYRRFARRLVCVWAPARWHAASWSGHAATRMEWVGRLALALFLRRDLNVKTSHGALYEGLSVYLSHLLVGTRFTWTVDRSTYGAGHDDWRDRLTKKGADWFQEARDLVAKGRRPDYPALLGKRVNDFTIEDLVHAYVFGAYLLEARPHGWRKLLTHVGRGLHHAEAVRKAMGLGVKELEDRVLRWLEERAIVQ